MTWWFEDSYISLESWGGTEFHPVERFELVSKSNNFNVRKVNFAIRNIKMIESIDPDRWKQILVKFSVFIDAVPKINAW